MCRNACWELGGQFIFASIQLYYSVDQFQQGFRERGRDGGQRREQGNNSSFIWFLNIMKYKHGGDKNSGALCCTHLDGLDFSQDDEQLEGPND